MKVKYQQLYSNECGLCAIKNLLKVYKIKFSYIDLKYNENGCSIKAMVQYLKKYFYIVKAIDFQIESLQKIDKFSPFIALIHKESISHYVVIYKRNNKYLYVLDSLCKKSYKITYKQFNQVNGNIFIICEEAKKIKLSILQNKKWFFLPILSFLESIFLMSTTVLLQQIIDNGFKDAVLYLIVQALMLFITTYKLKSFLTSYQLLDQSIVLKTFKGIYHLNMKYVNQHNIDEIYYRLYDAYTYKNMILSFLFNVINDLILSLCAIILMFVYSVVLAFIVLLICSIIVLISIKIFKRTKIIVENKRDKEYQFINQYRDSFTKKEEIYHLNDKSYYNHNFELLKEYQKASYTEEKIHLTKDVILVYFQTFIVSLIVILYFSKFYQIITIGSLVALINLLTLVLQPILNLCSQLANFSNCSLIRKRLKDIEQNINEKT